jgi:hypothetical protein
MGLLWGAGMAFLLGLPATHIWPFAALFGGVMAILAAPHSVRVVIEREVNGASTYASGVQRKLSAVAYEPTAISESQ